MSHCMFTAQGTYQCEGQGGGTDPTTSVFGAAPARPGPVDGAGAPAPCDELTGVAGYAAPVPEAASSTPTTLPNTAPVGEGFTSPPRPPSAPGQPAPGAGPFAGTKGA
jgi:hypothetical protein